MNSIIITLRRRKEKNYKTLTYGYISKGGTGGEYFLSLIIVTYERYVKRNMLDPSTVLYT